MHLNSIAETILLVGPLAEEKATERYRRLGGSEHSNPKKFEPFFVFSKRLSVSIP
jgi:hypothetical protein